MHPSTRLLVAMAAAALLSQPSTASAQTGPNLVIALAHSGNFTVGENGNFTIVVSNIGATASSGQIGVFYKVSPNPFGFVSATGTGGSCALHSSIPNTVLAGC